MLDAAISLIVLIVLLPVLLITALLILLTMGRPIFFRQHRSGMDEVPFRILKFRSMKNPAGKNGPAIPAEERQTALGCFMRSTGIDELPELFNILKGDMSLIGPRPLLVGYRDFYTDAERKRFLVRGGLVPPEVLFGDIKPAWDSQLIYEAYYAERVTPLLDLRILMAAFGGVFKRKRTDYGGYDRPLLSEERAAGR